MVNCLIGTRGRGWLRPLLVGEHRRLGAGLRLPRPPSLVGEHTTLQVMPPGTAPMLPCSPALTKIWSTPWRL